MHCTPHQNAYIFGVGNLPMVRGPGTTPSIRRGQTGGPPGTVASSSRDGVPSIGKSSDTGALYKDLSKQVSNDRAAVHLDDFFLPAFTPRDSTKPPDRQVRAKLLQTPSVSMLDVLNIVLPTDTTFSGTFDTLQFSPADESDGQNRTMQSGGPALHCSSVDQAIQNVVEPKASLPSDLVLNRSDGYVLGTASTGACYPDQVNHESCPISFMDIFQIDGEHAIQAPEWPPSEQADFSATIAAHRAVSQLASPRVSALAAQLNSSSHAAPALHTMQEGMAAKLARRPSSPTVDSVGTQSRAKGHRKSTARQIRGQSGVQGRAAAPSPYTPSKEHRKASRSRTNDADNLKAGHPSQPSRFCHICLRRAERVALLSCGNSHSGTCRKVVCEKCFDVFGWNWAAACAMKESWICTHCRDE
jgi:hypothetical protein